MVVTVDAENVEAEVKVEDVVRREGNTRINIMCVSRMANPLSVTPPFISHQKSGSCYHQKRNVKCNWNVHSTSARRQIEP